MPEQTITIGHKDFVVACQPGEEDFLLAAAAQLDAEARVLLEQIGRVPAERMLLMAGLMLADRIAALEDRAKAAESDVSAMRDEVQRQLSRPAPAARQIEVPVVPKDLVDGLTELAARAEALADQMEAKPTR